MREEIKKKWFGLLSSWVVIVFLIDYSKNVSYLLRLSTTLDLHLT